jgi:glycosyltransferase involved in cell wall biosynthesis
VSESVETHLKGLLPSKSRVIINGIPEMGEHWRTGRRGDRYRFLFVGRLTRLKGLHVVLEALGALKGKSWVLTVLGDGPQKQELELMAKNLDVEDQVCFQGFHDDVANWMAESDCLLFPSIQEGMPLTLMQAIRVGIPVLASRIDPIIELVGKSENLLQPQDVDEWSKCLAEILEEERIPPRFDPELVPTALQMAQETLAFMQELAACKGGAGE